jgi:hypothetical protein
VLTSRHDRPNSRTIVGSSRAGYGNVALILTLGNHVNLRLRLSFREKVAGLASRSVVDQFALCASQRRTAKRALASAMTERTGYETDIRPLFREHNILAMSDSRHCRRGGIVAGITRRDAVLIVGDLPEGRACLNQPTEAV